MLVCTLRENGQTNENKTTPKGVGLRLIFTEPLFWEPLFLIKSAQTKAHSGKAPTLQNKRNNFRAEVTVGSTSSSLPP